MVPETLFIQMQKYHKNWMEPFIHELFFQMISHAKKTKEDLKKKKCKKRFKKALSQWSVEIFVNAVPKLTTGAYRQQRRCYFAFLEI